MILTDLDTDPGDDRQHAAARAGRSGDARPPPPLDDVAGAVDLHVVGHDRRPEGRPPHRPLGDARRHRPDRHRRVARRRQPVAVPVSHIGGMLMLTAALMTGMRLVLFESFDPATSPERMAAHGATVLGSAVPFFLAYFDAQQRHGDEPLFPRLRMLTGGGAPTPPEISRMRARGPRRARHRQLVGPHRVPRRHLRPARRAARGPRHHDRARGRRRRGARRSTDDGRVCAPGEEGELRLRGPQCFLGYVDASLDAAAFDDDGWFRTGDLGVIDADGNVTVTGRIKDIIIRNAENISALEIEDALYQHPAVVDVAVVAAPDPRTGERVCAFVVPAPGATPPTLQSLAEHCRSLGLAVQKCPEQLELVDALPAQLVRQGAQAGPAGARRLTARLAISRRVAAAAGTPRRRDPRARASADRRANAGARAGRARARPRRGSRHRHRARPRPGDVRSRRRWCGAWSAKCSCSRPRSTGEESTAARYVWMRSRSAAKPAASATKVARNAS